MSKTKINNFSQMKMNMEQDIPDDINEFELITPSQTIISRNNSFDNINVQVSTMLLPVDRRNKYIQNGWVPFTKVEDTPKIEENRLIQPV